jgi:hypothetical protein
MASRAEAIFVAIASIGVVCGGKLGARQYSWVEIIAWAHCAAADCTLRPDYLALGRLAILLLQPTNLGFDGRAGRKSADARGLNQSRRAQA